MLPPSSPVLAIVTISQTCCLSRNARTPPRESSLLSARILSGNTRQSC
jgi:hypothetical protein